MSGNQPPTISLQSEPIPFSIITRNHLAQFAQASISKPNPPAPAVAPAVGPTSTASASAAPVTNPAPAPAPPVAPAVSPSSTASASAAPMTNPAPAPAASSSPVTATAPATQPPPTVTNSNPQSSSNATQPASTTSNAVTSSTSSGATIQVKVEIKPPNPKPIDLTNFKGTKFVSLDPLIVENRQVYEDVSGAFTWEMCESQSERGIEFISKDCVGKRVFLVCSGGQGKEVVPRIHHLDQLHGVYIYCASVAFHQEWSRAYPKVRMVCDNDDKYLLPQLGIDVAQTNLEWAMALLETGDKALAKKKLEIASKSLTAIKNRNPFSTLQETVEQKLKECQ